MIELKVILETQFMIRRLKSEVLKQLPQKIRYLIFMKFPCKMITLKYYF